MPGIILFPVAVLVVDEHGHVTEASIADGLDSLTGREVRALLAVILRGGRPVLDEPTVLALRCALAPFASEVQA